MTPSVAAANKGPLAGVRVMEFSHMVMGPSCGLVLADLGADVVKIEPAPAGDNTRRLTGRGARLFPDLQSQQTLALRRPETFREARRWSRRLIAPGTSSSRISDRARWTSSASAMRRCARTTRGSIYCSCKGFLPGPYEHRAALDEVVQMMGGLAYMTGNSRQALARRRIRQRHHGRRFRRAGDSRRVARARRDGARRPRPVRPVREPTWFWSPSTWLTPRSRGAIPRLSAIPNMAKPWPLYDVFDSGRRRTASVRGRRSPIRNGVRSAKHSICPIFSAIPACRRWATWPPRARAFASGRRDGLLERCPSEN